MPSKTSTSDTVHKVARTRGPKASAKLALNGSLWLQQGGYLLGGADRIALLEAIHQTGSMMKAAKVVGVSYKTAWDRVQDMNNTAGHPLVDRLTGGSGGGGTFLTPYALDLITAFRQVEKIHEQVLGQLTKSLAHPQEVLKTLSTLGLRTSARNQLVGTVTRVRAGEVDALVELRLPGAQDGQGDVLRASLTTTSLKELGIAKGMQAVALFKAPSVHLTRPDAPDEPAMHNSLPARVVAIQEGGVHTEVQVRLQGGQTLVSKVGADHVATLGLSEGSKVLAQFYDHAIILGVV
ncbi:MAG: LysR family transcriptional regulator [Rubrivivax sp.]|nr:MAG: LysR family transcriptional regulator [Rubrivivax sp.]